jgi:hypothetical protein
VVLLQAAPVVQAWSVVLVSLAQPCVGSFDSNSLLQRLAVSIACEY